VTVLETSVLVAALTDKGSAHQALRAAIERGERLILPALVIFEWLRGPRTADQLEMQEELFPASGALPFTHLEAAAAAKLYAAVPDPRGRELDIAIAAHALVSDAHLWTLNIDDFADLPGVSLVWPDRTDTGNPPPGTEDAST
jgi:predicted nucleic acid-binding protein